METESARVRGSARAVILDGDATLLVQYQDASPQDPLDPVTEYWGTVGGGLEDGESPPEALKREVFEELGDPKPTIGPCVWRRRRSLRNNAGGFILHDERYYLVTLSGQKLDHEGLTDAEQITIKAFRWWDTQDPATSSITVFPAGFFRLLKDIAEGNIPSSPLNVA